MNQLPIHPRTGLQAVGIVKGRPVWPILGGSGEGGTGDGNGTGETAPPASDWKPPATQADLDRIIQDRLARETRKYSDYETLKAKADAHDALQQELASDTERAVQAARQEEREKAAATHGPRLATAAIKAEAKGVLPDSVLQAWLEDADTTRYLTADGEPDTEKITAKIKALSSGQASSKVTTLGQGNRQGVAPKPGDQGRAMAAKRGFTKPAQ